MKGEEHRAEILRLRGEGTTYREIGERLGLDQTTVWNLGNPERYREKLRRSNVRRAAAKRAWERDPANRAKCADCGAPTSSTPAPSAPKRCKRCHLAAETRRVVERAHRIERWWAEGLTRREIGERLGWSDSRIGVEFARLRAAGFNLPYRYRLTRPCHESQVGARVAA